MSVYQFSLLRCDSGSQTEAALEGAGRRAPESEAEGEHLTAIGFACSFFRLPEFQGSKVRDDFVNREKKILPAAGTWRPKTVSVCTISSIMRNNRISHRIYHRT